LIEHLGLDVKRDVQIERALPFEFEQLSRDLSLNRF
jgi:hypothetical protein